MPIFESLIPIGNIKSYSDMRVKLALLLFLEVYLLTYATRDEVPVAYLVSFISAFSFINDVRREFNWIATFNIEGLFIAATIALASYIIILHDRISDMANIRLWIDKEYIIIPLVEGSGIGFNERINKAIKCNRKNIMRNIFYKYASSTSSHAIIDKHDIEAALTNLFFMWAFIELLCVLMIAVLSFSIFAISELVIILILLILIIAVMIVILFARTKGYAETQVNAILSNQDAKQEIRGFIGAL